MNTEKTVGIASRIAKNSFYSLITSISELGISFFVGMLLARNLGTTQYGLYSYMVWFLSIIVLLVNLGLGETGKRFISESVGQSSTENIASYVRLSLFFRTLASLAIALVVIASSGFWAKLAGAPDDKVLFIIIAVSLLPQSLQFALSNIFRGFQRFDYSFYLIMATGPLRLLVIIVLSIIGLDVMDVILINLATLILALIVGFVLLSRLMNLMSIFSARISRENRNRALKYSLTITGILLVNYIANQQAEIFFLGLYCTIDEVGFYRLAFQIGTMASMAPAAITSTLLPSVSEQFGKGDNEKIRSILYTSIRFTMMLAVPSGVGALVLAKPLMVNIYGPEFVPAILILQIVALPLVIFSISDGIGNVIRGINYPGYVLKVIIFAAAIKIGLSLWLIPQHGVIGASIAAVVPFIINLIFLVSFAKKKINVSWPFKDMVVIIASSAIMGTIVFLIQSHLNGIISLIVSIPTGIVVYAVSIVFLKAIRESDLAIFTRIGEPLPPKIKHFYDMILNLMRNVVSDKATP